MVETIGSAIAQIADKFSAAHLTYGHGTASAWDEAVVLVLGICDLPDSQSVLSMPVSLVLQTNINELAQRRIDERLPLAYLLGFSDFAGYRFAIKPGLVVPRSPIASLLLGQLKPWLQRPPRTILDLCSGTGCLGLIAAKAFENSKVTLADIDPIALELSERNRHSVGVADRVEIQYSDLLIDIKPQQFDLIICNPPYVDAADMSALPAEFQAEPALGLAGGEDGLDLIHRLLAEVGEYLHPDGLLVAEVGNSAARLHGQYPKLPFIWPDLPLGGEGVFILEGRDLTSHTD